MEIKEEFYEKGKQIIDDIEKYSKELEKATGEERETLKQKIDKLNEEKDKLKDELYKEAKEKSGLDYSKEDKNPEILRKKYEQEIKDLKKKKQDLRLEKINLKKLNEEKKTRIEQQFEMAAEKYKAMLDADKIPQELFESRINNMKAAKEKDIAMLENYQNIDKQMDDISSQIKNAEVKLDELHKQEIIYNDYGDLYYNLFGESLVDKNKLEKNIKGDENSSVGENKTGKKQEAKEPKLDQNNIVNNGQPQVSNIEDKGQEKEEPKVVITSKSVFNDLYKKLGKGTITDKELGALAEVLENPDNYDKYGITTGLVFNKAKKILKAQGVRTAKNIEQFLRENGTFSEDIKFDTSIEKDNILSHDILKSWKDVDDKLTYTDASFSIEKYIEKIEQYKEAGKPLTTEQEKIYKQAMDIKNALGSYRKAINTNEDVAMERNNKNHNSIFYMAFGDKIKKDSKRALPEVKEKKDYPGYIVMESLNLDGLVNKDPGHEEIKSVSEDGRPPITVHIDPEIEEKFSR